MATLSSIRAEPPWHAALHGLGLQLGGDAVPRRARKIRFGVNGGWGRFEALRPRRGDLLASQLGRAGLWKLNSGARRSDTRIVFELPPSVLPHAGSDANGFQALARWALSTAGGKPDRSWAPPPREEIERQLPETALTLQVGSVARQGTMTHETGRLAFEFPIVQSIPGDLPAARMAWLRELLTDGQDCWHLVRIGLTTDGQARAEVDLSGAPHDALEPLVPITVDALRLVVSSLVEPAEFLVHGTEGRRALGFPPTQKGRKV